MPPATSSDTKSLASSRLAGTLFQTPHFPGGLLLLGGIAASYLPRSDGHGTIRIGADYLGGILNTLFLILGAIALLVPAYQSRGKAGLGKEFLRVAALMLAETIFVHLLKVITGLWLKILSRPSGGWQGFPSGHTSAALVMSYLLTCRYPRLAIVWYAFAGLIAWSRVESGAHFPYQVIGGAIVGISTLFLLERRFPSTISPQKLSE